MTEFAQYEILVVGTGSAVVTDSAGNVTGWTDDAMFRNVPDVYYYDTGGDAVQIMVLTGEPLTVTFQSHETPLFVEIVQSVGEEIVEAVRYPELIIEPNTTLALALPLPETAPLTYDASGDDKPDTPVDLMPIRVTGSQAADTEPPTVTITLDADRMVSVFAEDPAGVAAVYLAFDEAPFVAYTGPVIAPKQVSVVYAFADDLAGNRSSLVSLSLDPTENNNARLFVPFVASE